METPPWVAALNISEEDFSEWLQIFPSPDFVLSWAIENKRIDENTYLKWASHFYEIPIVKREFFSKPPPLELWKKYLKGPWSPTVLPLYEWNNTLFVGVLEPKNFVLDDIQVRLVLAPSTAQNAWWHAYTQLRKSNLVSNSAISVKPPTPPVPPAPPTPPAFPPQEKEDIYKAIVLEPVDRPATPLGLEDHPDEAEINVPLPEEDPAPEGVNFDLSTLAPDEPPPLPVLTDKIPGNLEVEQNLLEPVEEMKNPHGLESAEIPNVPLNKLENLIETEISTQLPELNVDTPEPPPLPEYVPPSGVPEGAIKFAFDKLQMHYEKGMVLLKQEGSLLPYQWDKSWHLEPTQKFDVDLSQPSLFSIVVDSKHPFHGYARPSGPSDRFFKVWNKGKYPSLVTALPLKAHNEVFGVLLVVATKDISSQVILTDLEKMADELSYELAKSIGIAA